MDEILTFVVLWVILYLINLVSKKIRKPETGKRVPAPAPAVPQKSSTEVLDSGQPEPFPPQFPLQQPEELETREEYFEEEEEFLSQEIKSEESKKSDEDDLSSPASKEPLEEVIPEKSPPAVKPKMTLRQYIIWKEILDKPLSLRHPHSIKKNRVS